MRTEAKIYSVFILALFLSPIIVVNYSSIPLQITKAEPIKKSLIVYAENLSESDVPHLQQKPSKALVFFTHSHEAFQPIVQNKENLTAVYHPASNIMAFEDTIKNHFDLNDIQTEFLAIDTMEEMEKQNSAFREAYHVVRPFVEKQIKENEYDLIIDLHRDSAKRKTTTLTYNNQTYGKIYFVLGENNPNFHKNKEYAEQLSAQLDKLVPGISRGIFGKRGEHVDGVYNQDLAQNMVLIELGGIDNTEEEINRSISVLAKAISTVLQE
ncbi:stage II sporulation protein P [Sporosarcina luteola]|uniref:stage II sporulation protein P n=1 Tax=Sporosarcina luteola TaxID=582850 RepID=UPI00203B1F9C|nr:stage II sporulation protein P [Sporosarcina luteola]MCM3638212.1 stage II sporulation protein P [Sporosarcina luteola]